MNDFACTLANMWKQNLVLYQFLIKNMHNVEVLNSAPIFRP